MPERRRRFRRLRARAADLLGINARDRSYIVQLNPRRVRWTADDKVETKRILIARGIRVPETYRVVDSFRALGDVGEHLDTLEDFVIKPGRGRAGSGIVVLVERAQGGWRDAGGRIWDLPRIRRHVGNILFGDFARRISDRALFEQRLLAGIVPGSAQCAGLPDIRIIMHKCVPIMSMIRLPTARSSGRANLHQGAVGVGVDIQTGRTTHATLKGRSIERHPDTGERLIGQVFRQWAAVADIAVRTAAALPLGYMGLDIAVDHNDEPVVLEANVRPGIEIQNCNHRGLADALEIARSRIPASAEGGP